MSCGRVVFALLLLSLVQSCTLFKSMGTPEAAVPASATLPALMATVALKYTDDNYIFCGGVVHRAIILTSSHCLTDDLDYRPWAIVWPDAEQINITAEILYNNEAQDVAIIRPRNFAVEGGRPLAKEPPQYGHRAILISHPLSLGWSITAGIVSHPRRVGGLVSEDQVWVQISAQATGGSSGGPVFNEFGEIMGIVSFNSQHHHFVVAAAHLDNIRVAVDTVYRKKE